MIKFIDKKFFDWLLNSSSLKWTSRRFSVVTDAFSCLQIDEVNICVRFLRFLLFLLSLSFLPSSFTSTYSSTHMHVHIFTRAKHNCCHGKLFLANTPDQKTHNTSQSACGA